jgi:hypothetical protein
MDQDQTNTSPEMALPSTHFQTLVDLEDGTSVGLVVLEKKDGDIQFFLDRQLSTAQFGPQQIIEVLARLNSLTATLNKYVNDRITEARETLEKESQSELDLNLGVSTQSEACETGTCSGGCESGEVSPHIGQPE